VTRHRLDMLGISVTDAIPSACTEALRMASKLLCASALSIVELAITILEDDDCLNAGMSRQCSLDCWN
jgi:isoaspartyl peptidase/L-asparaginase-like protein (Ntn-hydrolase superfamily)